MKLIKTDLKITTNHVIGAVVVVAVGWVGYRGYQQAKAVAGDVVEAVNPASTNNIVYRGVNGVGSAISGNKDFSLGSWIFDIVNSEESKETVTLSADEKAFTGNNSEGIA
jgi:hypothetical protein